MPPIQLIYSLWVFHMAFACLYEVMQSIHPPSTLFNSPCPDHLFIQLPRTPPAWLGLLSLRWIQRYNHDLEWVQGWTQWVIMALEFRAWLAVFGSLSCLDILVVLLRLSPGYCNIITTFNGPPLLMQHGYINSKVAHSQLECDVEDLWNSTHILQISLSSLSTRVVSILEILVQHMKQCSKPRMNAAHSRAKLKLFGLALFKFKEILYNCLHGFSPPS